MRLLSIASGSSGNCIYVGYEGTNLLVDAGISAKRIEAGLNMIGLKTADIDGILITHEHSDHISGLKTIAVSGLANANALLQKIKSGEAEYDFIEIMACPGGCVNGGGQPHQNARIRSTRNVPKMRAEVLAEIDEKAELKRSDQNPYVQAVYDSCLGAPGSEKAHELLHTTYHQR